MQKNLVNAIFRKNCTNIVIEIAIFCINRIRTQFSSKNCNSAFLHFSTLHKPFIARPAGIQNTKCLVLYNGRLTYRSK